MLKGDDAPPIPNAPPFGVNDVVHFNAMLDALPGKTCEVALGCEHGAAWHVDLHGCTQTVACDQHKHSWLNELADAVSHGWARCPECCGEFTDIKELMTTRPI